MNGVGPKGKGLDGLALVDALLTQIKTGSALRCDLLVCPPATLITRVAERAAGSVLAVGGQDCHAESSGAHTGDISAEMLKDAGCHYVIIGHSERRRDHGETDEIVRAKAEAALRAGLIAIVCVGETEMERLASQAEAVVERQIECSLPKGSTAANTIIAYEPVWAIGTGRTPSSDDIAAMHGFIRRNLTGRADKQEIMRILYGGSVKVQNASEILKLAEVDGALVGGGSLKAGEFWAIAQSSP